MKDPRRTYGLLEAAPPQAASSLVRRNRGFPPGIPLLLNEKMRTPG